jgi:hypothetical protein
MCMKDKVNEFKTLEDQINEGRSFWNLKEKDIEGSLPLGIRKVKLWREICTEVKRLLQGGK